MKRTVFVTIGFTFHAALGSLCMVPMAMAHAMPMTHVMSPISAHCADCVVIQSDTPDSSSPSSCADHCLAKARSMSLAAVGLAMTTTATPALPSVTYPSPPADAIFVVPLAMAPPQRTITDTIVLRL